MTAAPKYVLNQEWVIQEAMRLLYSPWTQRRYWQLMRGPPLFVEDDNE